MNDARAAWALWLVPAIMLALALLNLPYGYYTLLRLVVCLSAALIAFREYSRDERWTIWVVAFVLIALLFNPLLIVRLERETWAPIDLGCALFYLAHFAIALSRRASS